MTAQIENVFMYRGARYAVASVSDGKLFAPDDFGLKTEFTTTACYRGYVAVFALADDRLILDEFHVALEPPEGIGWEACGPEINGVAPLGPDERFDLFNNHYIGLAFPLPYSGSLWIARDPIKELTVNSGYHEVWKYRDVLELVFVNGALSEAYNRSKEMQARRDAPYAPSDELPNPDAISAEDLERLVGYELDAQEDG